MKWFTKASSDFQSLKAGFFKFQAKHRNRLLKTDLKGSQSLLEHCLGFEHVVCKYKLPTSSIYPKGGNSGRPQA